MEEVYCFPRRQLIMPPPCVTGEVDCFPRRQLIFSFGRRACYTSLERSLRVHFEIDYFGLYHDIQTNSWNSF